MSKIRAVLFDLHGTLVYTKGEVDYSEISKYLFSKGYDVSPQQLKAAWAFVSFIDYPKHGYKSWPDYLSRILWRLKVKADRDMLDSIVKFVEKQPYKLYPDAARAVGKAKKHGLKTAIVTTIAKFKFEEAIKPIKGSFDLVMTGHESKCDKSNPRMYRIVLDVLGVQPKEAVMIGDDLDLDISLPRRLGINAILLDRVGKHKGRTAIFSVGDLNRAMDFVFRRYECVEK